MKKLIIALIALTAVTGFADKTYFNIPMTDTVVGALTNTATYTVSSKRALFVTGVYQTVGSVAQTNTATMYVTPEKEANVYSLGALTAVATSTSTLQAVGAGDASADVDPIVLTGGDVFTLIGMGGDSSNVTYRLRGYTVPNAK